ncbi:hypothetical protein M9Y10_001439 [Tritrichomonas musculus]|uniref:Smr domain-containing protein n=1 Tax=Tritrichomonas musculus TaxID=1915356 RepID=A0ABR2L734_9EUKA
MIDTSVATPDTEVKTQTKLSRSQRKKLFVYNPPEKQERKSNETQVKDQKIQEDISKNIEQIIDKDSDNNQSQTQANASKKNNKKKFVYRPQADQEKKKVEVQQTTNKQNEVQIHVQKTSDDKKNEQPMENNNMKEKKNNKKKFVYKPSQDKDNLSNQELKDNNKNNNKVDNNNNNQNNNNKNSNQNKKKYNNKNNNNKCNNKNNNKSNNDKNNGKKTDDNQFSESTKFEILNSIKYFANMKDSKEEESPEPVNYTTYIELDMHGSDPRAKRPLDWVPVIRDALFSALERNVDAVRFIPGKGLHSNPEIGPILRILVILTAKRLGFESYFNPGNEGVIICKVSSHSSTSPFVPHMPNKDEQDDLNKNDTLLKAFGLNKGDNLNIDNLAFRAVKSRFPHMPTICIAIICAKRNPKEALEFAQLFEDYLRSEDDFQQISEYEQKNEQLACEVDMVQHLEERYSLDHEIIKRVVREKRMKNKSQIILDRIENEIPEDFYNYLTEFLLNFSHIPIESLLDSMKEGLYNPKEITNILNSKSWKGMQNALGVMKVENKITTDRTDGRPKFIPSIEIDLANATVDRATKTMDKILNGLGNGNFSEIVLILAPQNQKSRKCSIDNVNAFLYNKASQEGFHIVRTRKADEKNNRYHFMVFNTKEEI